MDDEVQEVAAEHGIPQDEILPVSALNSRITDLFETAPEIASVHVLGEVTNLSTSADGHRFFTLKDDGAKIACVMFQGYADELEYDLQDGDSVLVEGTVEYYEAEGRASLKVYDVTLVGDGAYYAAIRKRKKQLAADGLFDEEHKAAVPRLPEQVGVVTSRHGSAVEDIIDAIHGRHPCIDIRVKHAAVQGDDATEELIAGVQYFDTETDVDVIVIGRGGGDIEALDAFNQESLVRAVSSCDTPVVSGVGHQTDTTLVGLAADYGAITPTAAGKQVAPRRDELERELDDLEERLDTAFQQFTARKERKEQLMQAASRERLYQVVIVILVLVLLVLFGVVLL